MVRSESIEKGNSTRYPDRPNSTLAIERRGGRGGGGTTMLVRPAGRDQRPWNKGLLTGSEKTSRTEARLVHSRSSGNCTIVARPCHLEPLHRQQASHLRLGQTSIGRHLLRCEDAASSNDRSKEDRSACAVRDHGTIEDLLEAWLPMLRTSGSRYLFPSHFMQGPTYPCANMRGWCIAGLKASA
jgi:hypothetical protein